MFSTSERENPRPANFALRRRHVALVTNGKMGARSFMGKRVVVDFIAGHVGVAFTEKVSCRLAHRVLAVSPSLRELVISENICSAEKIIVISHGSICGIDAEVFDPTPENRAAARTILHKFGIPVDAPVLGFVGRIVYDKGVNVLMEAWRELREAFPKLHLLLVGEFEDHQPLGSDRDFTHSRMRGRRARE